LFDRLVAGLAADHDWAVCAPDAFPDHQELDLAGRLAAAGQLDDARVIGDAVDAAAATGATRVGIIGFCMGGMYALKAAQSSRFDRIAAFYGMIHVPADWQGPGQGDPLEAVATNDPARVLAIVGTADDYTPPDAVDALDAAGAAVVRYEGAEHGFVHDPDRPAHRPADAADAWRRVIAHLRS